MKLAFIVNDIHLGNGGERVVSILSDDFIKLGNSVTIISLNSKDNREYQFSFNQKTNFRYLNSNLSKFSIINKLISILFLKKFFKKQDYDVVLGIGTYINVLIAMCQNKDCKTIGCEHSYFFSVSPVWTILRIFFYKRLSYVIALTDHDQFYLKKLNLKCLTIKNYLPFYLEDKKADLVTKKILSLGRLSSSEKGYDLMIDAFSDFCKVNKDWILEIRGHGHADDMINKKIQKLKIEDRVSILPSTKDVISCYMNSSIYLMTSRFEGLPMTLLEASECGLPMIAYDCKTGPAEIINDGENGFLIPCYDKKLLVEKLKILCNNEVLRKEMGFNSKQLAHRFHKKKILEQWITLFNKLQKKQYHDT